MKAEFIEILTREFECTEEQLSNAIKESNWTVTSVLTCMQRALSSSRGIQFTHTTDDGHEINPETEMVYWYLKNHTDGFPSHGMLKYNFELEKWTPHGWNTDAPVFLDRESVNEHIIKQDGRRKEGV